MAKTVEHKTNQFYARLSSKKTWAWIGEKFATGILTGIGTLTVYVIATIIVINTDHFKALKDGLTLRFSGGYALRSKMDNVDQEHIIGEKIKSLATFHKQQNGDAAEAQSDMF